MLYNQEKEVRQKRGERVLNVTIIENPDMSDNDVLIECRKPTPCIQSAAEILRRNSGTVIGSIDGVSHVISLTDILYFESVDKNGFFYTSNNVFHTDLRLYEAQEKFRINHFIRISKSMVVNMLKIDEISPYLAGKLRLKLINGEFIMVSRQYSQNIKRELGI